MCDEKTPKCDNVSHIYILFCWQMYLSNIIIGERTYCSYHYPFILFRLLNLTSFNSTETWNSGKCCTSFERSNILLRPWLSIKDITFLLVSVTSFWKCLFHRVTYKWTLVNSDQSWSFFSTMLNFIFQPWRDLIRYT